jgi:hypothetical protein
VTVSHQRERFLMPTASGKPGDTLPQFITGQGAVSPAVSTGAAPPSGTPLAQLPAPTLPVSLTVGGIAVTLAFIGGPATGRSNHRRRIERARDADGDAVTSIARFRLARSIFSRYFSCTTTFC